MKELHIDIECFSSAPLPKSGVYRYVESPDFEILLFGYSADGGPVQVVDLVNGEKIPTEVLKALTDDSVLKFAHNSAFERICLSRFLGMPTGEYLAPDSWRCTMVWAAVMGLPLSLEGVGTVLGLEKQKLTEGKALIKYFCQPCAPTKSNGGRTRNLPTHAPDKWADFKRYNARDVEVELAIQAKLSKFPVSDAVWDEYHQDQEINDRGVALDLTLVEEAIKMDGRSRTELTEAMKKLTELENPNSVQQMKVWLAENGLETDTLGKKAVAELLKTAPQPLGDALALRQQMAKSSVKKYQAMQNCVCADGRARGMFMFYGANRTGRWAGRLIQMQNLPQNHLPDLEQARGLTRIGDYEALKMLYEDVPDTLSQLIRTAFVPNHGRRFLVADFSAIEARVIAWLAGETWRQEVFASGGDIYCASASQMFKVPVEKHGVNGHLRQKGKQAELACIAEGQLVLTDKGLVPIERVSLEHRIWDGENWVRHDGVIFKGEREVITYEGLTATRDHLIWIEGEPKPVQLGIAAPCGAHLIQTGNGGNPVRLGRDYQPGEAMEQNMEPLLRSHKVLGLRFRSMAKLWQSETWQIKWLSKLFTKKANSKMARKTFDRCKATLRKPKRHWVPQLWRERDSLRFFKRNRSGPVPHREIWAAVKRAGVRQNQQRKGLRSWKPALCYACREQFEQTLHGPIAMVSRILAVCSRGGVTKAIKRLQPGRNHSGCGNCSIRKAKKLEDHQRTARLYDIRNAGAHHRFTVSDKLVHNCGYGGSVGALKAMGALEMGLAEEELRPLVDAWRKSNPKIVKLWWNVDRAAMEAVRNKQAVTTHGIQFSCQSGMLFITLPSGRKLAYVKPRLAENKFGGQCITYEGVGATKKWERIESYGPKFVENIVQAIARDLLCCAMQTLRHCSIVMHIHDEIVIEADADLTLQAVCEQMGKTPPWADGLLLCADGYICDFYQKN